MNNKQILAFDCASGNASISLMAGGQVQTRRLPQNRQAALLVSTIDAMMREAGLDYAALDLLVTTVGPGSFTGLRIGLAALHGFALVHQTPIKTLTTLEAMAWTIAYRPKPPEAFTVAMRAGKGEVYAQEFLCNDGTPSPESKIYAKPEAWRDWRTACFSNQLAPEAPNYLEGPDTAILCHIAELLPTTPLAEAVPLYIRPPDAKLPG